jgi:hypothetical protein
MMEPVRIYALTGATVIDGHGGAPLNDTTVLVENGVIMAVGSRESRPSNFQWGKIISEILL